MNRSNKTSNRERFRYGICLNDECPKCTEKTVQQIPLRKEFVCEECGKDLREVPAPKKKNPLPIIIAIIVVLVIAGAIYAIASVAKAKKGEALQEQALMIEQARLDSIAQAEADSIAAVRLQEEQAAETARLEAEANAAAEQARLAEEEAKAAKKVASSTSGRVDYGKWSGAWKAGKPNGTGTMKYTKEHLIDSRDPQKRVAKPGDYIIGEFANGKLVQGVWYDSSNNVKGSIIIGM